MTITARMRLDDVDSSMIKAVGYDPRGLILAVQFHNGRTRHYLGVPADVYDELRSAPSPGRYFMKHVRHRYNYRSVQGPGI